MNYTTGPWAAIHIRDNNWQVVGCSPFCPGTTQTICEINGPWEASNYKANAYLIAAAPELLEALQELVNDQIKRLQAANFTQQQINEMPFLQKTFAAIDKAKRKTT